MVMATVSDVRLTLDPLVIAGKTFSSRLILGTGKYRSLAQMQGALDASGTEIITVAVRRVQVGQEAPGHQGLAQAIDWANYWLLPNTAGCSTADEAVRCAHLGRELCRTLGQEDNNWVKLEVIADSKYLLPDPLGTLEAAERLVKAGFAVLPYISPDVELARRLWELGTVTVMPLGSPIGSGQGLKSRDSIQLIIERSPVPVVVDAGIAVPSEACESLELGAQAVLVNTAIAQAQDPALMAQAMAAGVAAGRFAYRAGRIARRTYAQASSPTTGLVGTMVTKES
jgi:thiazole synthase